jgi:hypothetical protein
MLPQPCLNVRAVVRVAISSDNDFIHQSALVSLTTHISLIQSTDSPVNTSDPFTEHRSPFLVTDY